MDYPDLRAADLVALDTECTGLDWWQDKVFGIAVAVPGKQWYFDIRQEPGAVDWLNDQINDFKATCFHNAKFDIHMLREVGVNVPMSRVHDTMIRAALIDEHLLEYGLDALGTKYLGHGKDTSLYTQLAALFGGKPTKNAQMPNLHKAPVHIAAPYACTDVRVTIDLYQWQEKELEEQNLWQVYDLERRLLPVIVDMEHRGVRVDVPQAKHAASELTRAIKVKHRELNKTAGFEVNPNPSSSIHKLFAPELRDDVWYANDGTPLEKTGAGKASLGVAALEQMSHPAAPMIMELRELIKARDTFLNGHILGHHHNGVIHANFNQTKSENRKGGMAGTGTGRLSCNAPALQQIHKRKKKLASIVRSIFVPDEGQLWGCHDWAQMDFRVFAHYVKNQRILEMYRADPLSDYHAIIAGETGLPRSKTAGIKGNAKQINLGLVFGMGPGKLASEMGLPFTVHQNQRGGNWLKPGAEAEAVFEMYHEKVPGVRSLLDKASSVAKSRGYVITMMGRRIRFPGGMFTHKAGGLIFQGTAADALKLKLVEVHELLQGTEGRLLLNVHDEFDTSLPEGPRGIELAEGITHCLETFEGDMKFRVPIRSDFGMGPNWWEASKG